MYQYKLITPDLSIHFWESYHALTKKNFSTSPYLPMLCPPSLEKFKKTRLRQSRRLTIYVLFRGDRHIGILEHLKGVNRASFHLFSPSEINLGVSIFLKDWFEVWFQEKKCKITTSQQQVKTILENVGGKCIVHDLIQELDIKKLNSNYLKQLIINSKKMLTQHQLSYTFHIFLSGQEMEKYVHFYNEIIKDILVLDRKYGEAEVNQETVLERYEVVKSRGGCVHYLLVHDAQQNLVGLNEVNVYKSSNVQRISSRLTAVKQTYRGKGIAQFIKASMIQFLRNQYETFEVLDTTNSSVNVPILKLNKKLGFEPVSEEFILDYTP